MTRILFGGNKPVFLYMISHLATPYKTDLKIDSTKSLTSETLLIHQTPRTDSCGSASLSLPQMLIQVSNLGSTVKLSLGGTDDL